MKKESFRKFEASRLIFQESNPEQLAVVESTESVECDAESCTARIDNAAIDTGKLMAFFANDYDLKFESTDTPDGTSYAYKNEKGQILASVFFDSYDNQFYVFEGPLPVRDPNTYKFQKEPFKSTDDISVLASETIPKVLEGALSKAEKKS